jgi:regulator of CtrA degradation
MQAPAFIHRTYDETMDLMIEARNYMRYVEQRERRRAEAATGLRISCEAMRVTSRLTQVMAWLLMQRAVEEGEITAEQALAESNRISGAEVCLDDSFGEDDRLPRGLRSLMDRSLRLYCRIVRLEAQMVERTLH